MNKLKFIVINEKISTALQKLNTWRHFYIIKIITAQFDGDNMKVLLTRRKMTQQEQERFNEKNNS